jgi:NAD(P)-dependent dehydrogenase (short-subunit alcohol dehydrogenase family)
MKFSALQLSLRRIAKWQLNRTLKLNCRPPSKHSRGLGTQAAFIQADVRRENDVSNLVDQTIARFGRLAVAVNNAGTEGKPGPVIEQTPDSYTAMFDTNVLGTLLSLKHELRVMEPQGSGNIVNISSTMGERGAANFALYTASKHAVEGCVPAMRFTVAIPIYIHTPGTILRLSELFDGDDSGESAHDDKQKPHGPLQVVPRCGFYTYAFKSDYGRPPFGTTSKSEIDHRTRSNKQRSRMIKHQCSIFNAWQA